MHFIWQGGGKCSKPDASTRVSLIIAGNNRHAIVLADPVHGQLNNKPRVKVSKAMNNDIPVTMTAFVLEGHGGLDKLVLHDNWPVPEPAQNGVMS